MNPENSVINCRDIRFIFSYLVLARTCTESVPVLAGDIGQSGLVPGRETNKTHENVHLLKNGQRGAIQAKRGAPLPTRYGDFIPLGRPAGGGRGVSEKVSGQVFRKWGSG